MNRRVRELQSHALPLGYGTNNLRYLPYYIVFLMASQAFLKKKQNAFCHDGAKSIFLYNQSLGFI